MLVTAGKRNDTLAENALAQTVLQQGRENLYPGLSGIIERFGPF